MAPRANWQGYLKLSLVSCAVALYPASSTRERVSFNTLSRKTGRKVRRVYVDPESGEEVAADDQVKGYALGPDTFVVVEDEELDAIRLESAHTIDIEKFVPRAEIDPRYLETPYYITPNDKVALEPFAVIRDAMQDGGMVGLGRVVVARRERIVMLEPLGRGLLGTLLRYAVEVRDEQAYFDAIPDVTLPAEMRDLAHVILQRKSGHFEPAAFTDRYEEALTSLLGSKQAGSSAGKALAPPSDNVVDLMEALRRSLGGPTAIRPGRTDDRPAAPAPKTRPKAKAAKDHPPTGKGRKAS